MVLKAMKKMYPVHRMPISQEQFPGIGIANRDSPVHHFCYTTPG